jgi:hypothetical protein
MRFAQARQRKGSRQPRTVRPAFFLVGADIGVSLLFYPQVRPKPESALRITMRLEEIPDTSLAADLCRRILRAQAMTAAARANKESQNDAA